jgi:L-alanine-DL-glutamate epimerase-like enolase superfamily enzyme
MLQTVQQGYESGFRAFKIRMDWNSDRLDREPTEDMRRFSACRDFLPDDVPLSFDANNGYSSSTAILQGRELEAMGAAHFEEPVPQHDLPGLREVTRALDIPVSFGEQQHTRWQFRDLIELGQPDILQPDIVLAGGITESRRIYDLAETFGKQVMPHCPTAGIANAASLQLYATYSAAVRPHEYSEEFSGDPAELLAAPYVRSGSEVALSGLPGLGVELDESKLARLIVDD